MLSCLNLTKVRPPLIAGFERPRLLSVVSARHTPRITLGLDYIPILQSQAAHSHDHNARPYQCILHRDRPSSYPYPLLIKKGVLNISTPILQQFLLPCAMVQKGPYLYVSKYRVISGVCQDPMALNLTSSKKEEVPRPTSPGHFFDAVYQLEKKGDYVG